MEAVRTQLALHQLVNIRAAFTNRVTTADEIIRTFGEDVLPHRVEHGPRKGAHGYDPILMVARRARSPGIVHVETLSTCTSCLGLDNPDTTGYGDYYSNIRDTHGVGERNLALATLTP